MDKINTICILIIRGGSNEEKDFSVHNGLCVENIASVYFVRHIPHNYLFESQRALTIVIPHCPESGVEGVAN